MNKLDKLRPRTMDARVSSHNDLNGRDGDFQREQRFGRCRPVRALLLATAGLVMFVSIGVGLYQFPAFAEMLARAAGNRKAEPQSLGPTAAPVQSQPATASPDLFTSHAVQAGANRCAGTYGALGKALTSGAAFMVQTKIAKNDADEHALEGIVGMTFTSGNGSYSGPAAGLVFASPTARGCEGTMVRSVPFAQDCQAVTTLLPKGSAALQPLSGIAVYALSSGGQLMLIPAGSGCVAMTIARSGE